MSGDAATRGRLFRMVITCLTASVAVLICVATVLAGGSRIFQFDWEWVAVVSPVLILCVLIAYQFPVYIRHNAKLCVFTVPIYLIAVFLPPPWAAGTACLAIVLGETLVRARHGNSMLDVITHGARWMLIVEVASIVAHTPSQGALSLATAWMCAAGVLWLGDFLTITLVLCPLSGESPTRVVVSSIRDAGMAEASQYIVAFLGALLVTRQVWALVLLALPTLFLYIAYRKEVDSETLQLLESMADTVDMRDPYTVGHSQRVQGLAGGILSELGRNGQEAALIHIAARLHDIGKLSLPDSILLNTGLLTEEQRSVLWIAMERGAEILKQYPDCARSVEMVRHHHERWDGSGYPDGLRGSRIPFGARIIAVADAFDAMTSHRLYRPALAPELAAAILAEGGGTQWDPEIVDAFLLLLDRSAEESPRGVPLASHASIGVPIA